MPLINKYPESELISDILEGGVKENRALKHLIYKNQSLVYKICRDYGQLNLKGQVVLNDSILVLIRNIKNKKFRGESSVHTYLVGIAKMIVRNRLSKNKPNQTVQLAAEHINNYYIESSLNELEFRQENKERWKFIRKVITDKCFSVLKLWASGYTMNEIASKMNYSNSQIAMNKKNTCIKAITKKLKDVRG